MSISKRPLEAVFLDLDGSLLNSSRQVGERDRRTIARLTEQGVRVCIATGRHYELSARYSRELGLIRLPFLSSDGATLYHPGERRVIYHHPIPADLVLDILQTAVERGEEFYFHDVNTACFSPNFGRLRVWQDYAAGCGPDDLHPALGGMPEDYLEGEPAVTTFMAHLPTPDFCRELVRLCKGRAPLYLQPEGHIAIVSSPGWDKGRGAAWVAEREGFSLENAMALGDTGNDLPLLRAVGWPVVPENGGEDAKALARFITADNDHDPLTRAVEQLFPECLRGQALPGPGKGPSALDAVRGRGDCLESGVPPESRPTSAYGLTLYGILGDCLES